MNYLSFVQKSLKEDHKNGLDYTDMLAQINSPLMPLTQDVDKTPQTTPPLFQTVGILLCLYSLHWQHNTQTIGQWLGRVMPLLSHQQVRLFFTEDHAPYGFASWIEVPEPIHQQLLKNATWAHVEPQLTQLLGRTIQAGEPRYLWFIDLMTPFSHALGVTNDLKQQLSNHQNAWALNINQGQHSPRQVW